MLKNISPNGHKANQRSDFGDLFLLIYSILTVFFITDQGCYELTKQMTQDFTTDHAQVTLSNSESVGTYSTNVSVEMNRYFELFL